MLKGEVVDSGKAAIAALFTGGLWANISFPQVVTIVGGIYTLVVAIEKFAKIASWLVKKFRKPE